jgi:hypothetical protein
MSKGGPVDGTGLWVFFFLISDGAYGLIILLSSSSREIDRERDRERERV